MYKCSMIPSIYEDHPHLRGDTGTCMFLNCCSFLSKLLLYPFLWLSQSHFWGLLELSLICTLFRDEHTLLSSHARTPVISGTG